MHHFIRLFVAVIALTYNCVHAHAFEVRHGQVVHLAMKKGLPSVAETALGLLAEDMSRVLGCDILRTDGDADIVCAIDDSLPREGFMLYARNKHLYISGADAHGIAYGMMELSRLMGVSPWEDWADATPRSRKAFILKEGYSSIQHPAVAFRGIFINDEDWGLNPWATSLEPASWTIKHGRIRGAVGPEVTERIFRLMLRLRLNYYWPPMHECTQPFFLTSGNREVAARYGIYIGGSHCEPMASSTAAEWGIRGEGEYNYVSNRDNVQRFWQERLDSVRGQEIVYTLGMRGVHDGAMQGVKTREDKLHYLQQVIDHQREMLSRTTGRHITDIPQVFVPYKEVLDIYHDGLRVPDDVTLMWTDDNYGYVRHFPTAEERQRKGGNGLYYHVSYWGRPHDYCWLATLSPYLMEQQLTESYHRGIRRMWMLNVGDIKPAEVQIHVYSQLAWHGVSDDLAQCSYTEGYIRDMMQGIFPQQSRKFYNDIVHCLNESYRLAWDRKPEHMAGTRTEEADKAYWNTVRAIAYWSKEDTDARILAYRRISNLTASLAKSVDAHLMDAYFQLVQYPIMAATQMNVKYLCPELSSLAHDSISRLTRQYNEGFTNNAKWKGIMSASPRSLRVFDRASSSDLPSYKDNGASIVSLPLDKKHGFVSPLRNLGTHGVMQQTEKDRTYLIPFKTPALADSVTIVLHLLPNHPVVPGRLSFALNIDNGNDILVHYETYDRSETWKQNVLRNLAECVITMPVPSPHPNHIISFRPLSEGIILDEILLQVRNQSGGCCLHKK